MGVDKHRHPATSGHRSSPAPTRTTRSAGRTAGLALMQALMNGLKPSLRFLSLSQFLVGTAHLGSLINTILTLYITVSEQRIDGT